MKYVEILSALLLLNISFALSLQNITKLPASIAPVVMSGSKWNGTCPQEDKIKSRLNSTKAEIKHFIHSVDFALDDISKYCGGDGWRNIAYLNMNDYKAVCPSSLNTYNNQVRGCSRKLYGTQTCDSVLYNIDGYTYTKVCGRVIGYQLGATDAFRNSYEYGQTSIENSYVDGVSLTHGPVGSRQHIWTFVAARFGQYYGRKTGWNCRCVNPSYYWPHQEPTFVGSNYFCDSGNPETSENIVFFNNPLWDGEGCSSPNTCCEFNHPPWFSTTLDQATNEDIELRLCHGDYKSYEDLVINVIEIYVK